MSLFHAHESSNKLYVTVCQQKIGNLISASTQNDIEKSETEPIKRETHADFMPIFDDLIHWFWLRIHG